MLPLRRTEVGLSYEKGEFVQPIQQYILTKCLLAYSMLLKSDLWRSEEHDAGPESVRGAINFRNIPGTNIYALGQPNEETIEAVVRRVKEDYPSVDKVAWINLRCVSTNGERSGILLTWIQGGTDYLCERRRTLPSTRKLLPEKHEGTTPDKMKNCM